MAGFSASQSDNVTTPCESSELKNNGVLELFRKKSGIETHAEWHGKGDFLQKHMGYGYQT